jgi:signal transduction histidine kinase/DNA-binding response OmpR family regulator
MTDSALQAPEAPRARHDAAPLRRYVLTGLAVIIVLWSLAQLGSVHLLVERSYRGFENQDGLTNAMRLDGFLTLETQRIRQVARDWAYWDDTVAYLQGRNDGYVAENLHEQTFGNLAIDLMVLERADGPIVYERHVDAKTGKAQQGAYAAVRRLLASEQGRRVLAERREVTGLMATDSGILAFAAVPVLTTEHRGEPAGILIFGRDLDKPVLDEARQQTILDVGLFAADTADWPPDAAAVWESLAQSPQHVAKPVSADRLGAYVFLKDYAGRPIGLLRTLTPRDTKERFEQMGRYLLGISILLGGVLAAVMVWMLERRVLAPLAGISQVVSAVAHEGDMAQRVATSERRDELAQLGREINDMLAEIANQQQLREARDKALAASDEKSRFLAHISHAIRTPMNGILGMLELVLETELSVQQQERVQAAYHSAEGLLSLLNDILDFSKLESGQLQLEQREFELRELVENEVTLFAPTCDQKGISISCFVEPTLARHTGDPYRIRQILTNLVGNAAKFTAQGEVTVEARPGDLPDSVQFIVADTGIGIPPEHVATLFQPFAQVDAVLSRRYGGTGLGLAICRQLVERMGGTLDVASAPGSGTRFACTLRLPVVASAPAPVRGHDGLQALVLGPHDGTRQALSAYLKALGFEVRTRPQSAAVSLAEGGKVDLLVLDETIGGTAAGVLRSEATRRQIPMLRLANFTHAQAASLPGRGVDPGSSVVLRKPVLFDKLHAAVERVLNPALASLGPNATPVAVSHPRSLVGKRVLLVEDNAVNQALALGMLEAYEVSVECAENGHEALDKLAAAQFDLVLMDCQMPGMDGLEATRRWRMEEQKRGATRVPIVALTANVMSGDRQACIDCGMDDYLAKPFTRANLTDVLRLWIGSAPPPPVPADGA